METVLLYAKGPSMRNIVAELEDFNVLELEGPAELARRLVVEPGVLCLVLQSPELPEDFEESLQAFFPTLPVFLLPDQPTAGELQELAARLGSLRPHERRERPRFDWPLRGTLSLPGTMAASHDLRNLSSSGAFLHCAGPCPPAGSRGRLRVLFPNFSLETDCEVLDERRSSSRHPDGFAVRFTNLSEKARARLDRMVRDALVRALLEPRSGTAPPMLGEGEPLPAGFRRQ
jgi:hypothetical protein